MNPKLAAYIEELGDESRTVTKVTAQSKRRDRVSVFVQGEFAFGLTDEIAARHGIRPGAQVDAPTLGAVSKDEEVMACKRVALRYISYRMRSEAEVRRRLMKEGAAQQTIGIVLDELRNLGLVDDAAFAGAFARDALRGRKWGPHRIQRGLARAGIRSEDAQDALKEVRTTIEDEDTVGSVAQKRWLQLARITDPQKRKKRLYDYLVRRGFDFDDVRRVVDKLSR